MFWRATTSGWPTPRRSPAGIPGNQLPLPLVLRAPGRHPCRPPVTWALAGAKADERDVLLDLFDTEPRLLTDRPGQTILADQSYRRREFEHQLTDKGTRLLIPAYRNRKPRSFRP
ncbi:hypothetical protein [Cryptosporangium sp. NPDC051539]|uniref:hypothetical protein n=1 Tax=Cryptosporangium sp. NPDC051539 TaxID=3363962 RepID=UPI00379B0F9A